MDSIKKMSYTQGKSCFEIQKVSKMVNLLVILINLVIHLTLRYTFFFKPFPDVLDVSNIPSFFVLATTAIFLIDIDLLVPPLPQMYKIKSPGIWILMEFIFTLFSIEFMIIYVWHGIELTMNELLCGMLCQQGRVEILDAVLISMAIGIFIYVMKVHAYHVKLVDMCKNLWSK